jgi:Lhr-like helicase
MLISKILFYEAFGEIFHQISNIEDHDEFLQWLAKINIRITIKIWSHIKREFKNN